MKSRVTIDKGVPVGIGHCFQETQEVVVFASGDGGYQISRRDRFLVGDVMKRLFATLRITGHVVVDEGLQARLLHDSNCEDSSLRESSETFQLLELERGE